MLAKLSFALLLIFAASGRAQQCVNFEEAYEKQLTAFCPGTGRCDQRTPPEGAKECCSYTHKDSKNKCWSIYDERTRQRQSRNLGGNTAQFQKFVGTLESPKEVKSGEVRRILDQISKEENIELNEIGGQGQARTLQQNARQSRNLLSNPLGFAALLGGGSLFPECPVHVKLCHRVRCGGFYGQNNPLRCLSDPRCCYDYKLAFVRSVFGPGYLGDAPNCYYGATSKQWIYITNFFKPWNSWYTGFILDAFEDLFNTNAFNIAGQFLCDIDFGRKAYPVGSKSKLECNLVSGCWDESLPVGYQCLMASEVIQQLFGQTEVYPSLFTDDPSETQCSANWLEFGPKAYKRLECGVGLPPPSLFDMLYRWCPISDCCLNYLALSTKQKRDLSLLSFAGGLGGGNLAGLNPLGGSAFNPFSTGLNFGGISGLGGTTPLDPTLFSYLLGGSIGDDLSKLFCPYRPLSFSSIFPDMSDVTDGCCDIPTCYHKKKLVGGGGGGGGGFGGGGPTYRWGQYGPCSASCGPGIQSRTCFFGNQPVQSPQSCSGPPTQSCQGPPCQVPYQFGDYGPCSVSCGQGARSRSCYSGNTVVSPNFCVGPATESCQGPPCQARARWGNYGQPGACSVTCGSGTLTYRRPCLIGSQPTNPANCPGGAASSVVTQPCTRQACGPAYQWSQDFVSKGPCSVTCGQGFEVWGRACRDGAGNRVQDSFCPGSPPTQNRQCNRQPCPQRARWSRWADVSECGATCGDYGLVEQERKCVFPSGAQAPERMCPPGIKYQVVSCNRRPCGVCYYTRWTTTVGCRRTQYGCQMEETRGCYVRNQNGFSKVPEGECCDIDKQTKPCQC